jgi:hypothetical protein
MLTRVGKTEIFGADGSPVYAINHQIVPQLQFPKKKSKNIKYPDVV